MRLSRFLWPWLVAAMMVATPAAATRYAFVVAVDDYRSLPSLGSAVADARHVAAALEATGFRTTLVVNAGAAKLVREMARFRSKLGDASLVLAYVAGHGLSLGEDSIFLPADAALTEGGPKGGVPLDLLVEGISSPRAQTLVYFDACRVRFDPAPDTNGRVPRRTAGTYVLFATAPMHAAADAVSAPGPFARALAEALTARGFPVEEVGRRVRLSVLRATHGLQVPWELSSLIAPVRLGLTATE